MKITKSQLKEIIKEEVSKLQKKTILENRKKVIVREIRMINENDGSAPSILGLILPFNPQSVQPVDGFLSSPEAEDLLRSGKALALNRAKLIDLNVPLKEQMFGDYKYGTDGELSQRFPHLFSREALQEKHKKERGYNLEENYIHMYRKSVWLEYIDSKVFHYVYGDEGNWFSRQDAIMAAVNNGKEYAVAEYVS